MFYNLKELIVKGFFLEMFVQQPIVFLIYGVITWIVSIFL